MWTNSLKATASMLALCVALAGCAGSRGTAVGSADWGSDMQPVAHIEAHRLATPELPGPDNTSP